MNLLLIGAGQLGSRHLQSAVKYTGLSQVWVVDPSSESLQKVQKLVSAGSEKNLNISFVQTIPQAKSGIDFCIIATSSKERLRVLQEVISTNEVKSIVLEKFLFPCAKDFVVAESLLKGLPAWVNCPRRMYRGYQQIKEFLTGKVLTGGRVWGGNWGLACNSIHFIDLFSFLSNQQVKKVRVESIFDILESKRAGYFEIRGELKAQWDCGEMSMISEDNSMAISVEILFDGGKILVEESLRQYTVTEGSKKQVFSMDVPFQSELTAPLLQDIFEKNCRLPTFFESSHMHLIFLKGVGEVFASKTGRMDGYCPIT